MRIDDKMSKAPLKQEKKIQYFWSNKGVPPWIYGIHFETKWKTLPTTWENKNSKSWQYEQMEERKKATKSIQFAVILLMVKTKKSTILKQQFLNQNS